MQAAHSSATRGARAGTPSEPNRLRLGKQQWQDIRRARTLGAEGELYGVEIHGVKLLFRWKRTHGVEPSHDNKSCGEAPAKAREARSRSAQSLPVRTEKPMNHRQRRSAQRLQAFMRSKQGPHTSQGVAERLPRSQPNGGTGTPEPGAREPSGSSAKRQPPKAVENDEPMATDHAAKAAKLYTAWKQDALAGSPARGKEREAMEASPTRARGRSREKQAPESGGPRSSCSCSSEHMSTDMTTPDSDTYAGRRRLEPMPIYPHMGAMVGGRGGGKSKGGSKSRGKGRGNLCR